MTKSIGIVENGVVIKEWRNRAPFVLGGLHYSPGAQADDAWFKGLGLYIITRSQDTFNSETETLEPVVETFNHAAQTVTRHRTKRNLTAQELDANADAAAGVSRELKAVIKTIAQLTGNSVQDARTVFINKWKATPE